VEHGLHTVTTNESKIKMGCDASKYQGCAEKYTTGTTQINGGVKNKKGVRRAKVDLRHDVSPRK